jgi:tRNA isopentenyl-2-thiomethyl-A-37 hydroxylase MiaE
MSYYRKPHTTVTWVRFADLAPWQKDIVLDWYESDFAAEGKKFEDYEFYVRRNAYPRHQRIS